jgi:hypothetical protein
VKESVSRHWRHAKPHAAGETGSTLARLLFEIVRIHQDVPRAFSGAFAGWRQVDASAIAIKQLQAEPLLKCLDGPRQRRLSDTKFIRSPAVIQAFRQEDEVLE